MAKISRIFEPLDYQKKKGIERNPNRCAYKIYENGFPRQCFRKPIQTIEGYGFCTQHANEVRKKRAAHGTCRLSGRTVRLCR